MIRSVISACSIVGMLMPSIAVAQSSNIFEWPSWVDCIEWLDSSCESTGFSMPENPVPSVPNIPERFRPIYYDRMTGELVLPKERAEDWPTWIGVPGWYK